MNLLYSDHAKIGRKLRVMASILAVMLLLYGCARPEGRKGQAGPPSPEKREAIKKEALKKARARVEAREKLRSELKQEATAGKKEAEEKAPAPAAGAETEQVSEQPKLTELTVAEFPGGLQVTVGATSLLQFTAYPLKSPPRLAINIFGTGVGSFKEPSKINQEPVETVSAVYLQDKDITRLEIELSKMVPYSILREENNIVVSFFSKPGAELKPMDAPPSIKVTGMRYGRLAKQKQVRVETDFTGENPQFKVVKLKDPLRLMLEIKDALVIGEQKLEPDVPLGSLKSVSLSQSQEAGRPIARIVALLSQTTPYIVYQEGNTIKLDIAEPPPVVAAAKAPPKAAPTKAAPPKAVPPKPGVEEEKKEVVPRLVRGRYKGAKISLDFQEAEMEDVLRLLAEVSGLNIITGPSVSGSVNLKMEEVPWDQVLDLILRIYGYNFLQEGNVLWIDQKDIIEQEKIARKKRQEALEEEGFTPEGTPIITAKKKKKKVIEYVTRVFYINYMATTRSGTGALTTGGGDDEDEGGGAATGQSTITTEDAPDIWGTITEGLNMILFGTASVEPTRADGKKMLIVNKFAGIIQITATPDDMARAAEFLETVEGAFLRQVMIQATIMEVILSDDFQMGVDWSLVGEIAGDLAGGLGGNLMVDQSMIGVGVPATIPTGVFNFGVTDNDNVTFIIDALSVQGDIHTLSNPKISTLNNQKAVIKVGREEVFFDVVTTVTQGVATLSATAQNITVGLVLDVTPQVNPDGRITMWVHPSITELLETVVGPANATAPRLTTRETDTVITMMSGQTLVIAGLIQDRVQTQRSGVPFLSKIPLLGALFRQSFEMRSKSELVILISPTVIEEDRIKELTMEQVESLKRAPKEFFK